MSRILLAPDSFKGSLSATQFCQIATQVIEAYAPQTEVISLPLSDGGEGFVDAYVTAGLASRETLWVSNPLGRKTKAAYGWQQETQTAIIEMAQASGLPKIRPDERNPLQTHSLGTGQLISAAIEQGAKRIILGLGGSATNDGGAAALSALGIPAFDAKGKEVMLGGQGLGQVAEIGDVPEHFLDIEWVLACDVTNPLLGDEGATAVFGPQKGLQPQQFDILEKGLENWANVIQQKTGKDVRDLPGAGAAGGMAAGFIGLLDAKIEPGFEVLRQSLQIDRAMEAVDGQAIDWVITGEGRIDEQTAYGKLPMRIAEMAKERDIPCIGICGSLGVSELEAFTSLFSIVNTPMHEVDAMTNAQSLFAACLQNLLPLMNLK